MPKAVHDDPAPPPPQPAGGLITIRWWRLPEPFESELDWEYQPIPPIPNELGQRLLGEVADRLSPAEPAQQAGQITERRPHGPATSEHAPHGSGERRPGRSEQGGEEQGEGAH
jgi:hypothetical protein